MVRIKETGITASIATETVKTKYDPRVDTDTKRVSKDPRLEASRIFIRKYGNQLNNTLDIRCGIGSYFFGIKNIDV